MLPPKSVTGLIRRAETSLANRDYKGAHQACIDALKLDPATPDAFYLLGVLTAEHDNHGKAVELFERAIALANQVGRYHAWRGRSLIALNRREEAIVAADTAAGCNGLEAQTLDTVGVVFSRAGLHKRATDYYRKATDLMPDRPDYWYNLGVAEQFQGDFEAAKQAFRKTIDLVPGHVKAWSSLIQIGKQLEGSADIAALEELFDGLTSPDDRLFIGHALAKAHEDFGDGEAAMAWLAKAKTAKKVQINYAPAQDRAMFDAAAGSLSVRAPGHDDPAPIFIVGLPRTGTTLVDRILSSHSQVQSAGELTDFALALKRATQTTSRYVLDAETLIAAHGLDLADVGDTYIKSARRIVPDSSRFIDKMPLNFLSAALIHKALPNARIICLRRHPADSVLSNYRQLFATEFSYYNYAFDLAHTAEYYAMFAALIEQFRGGLPDDRFTEVHYEHIVDDLEGEARRLIAFCGLDWEPACLSFHDNAAPVATASSAQVRQPLYSSSVGRWKRYARDMQPALEILRQHGLIPTDH